MESDKRTRKRHIQKRLEVNDGFLQSQLPLIISLPRPTLTHISISFPAFHPSMNMTYSHNMSDTLLHPSIYPSNHPTIHPSIHVPDTTLYFQQSCMCDQEGRRQMSGLNTNSITPNPEHHMAK